MNAMNASPWVPACRPWRHVATGITAAWLLGGVSTAALAQSAGPTDRGLDWVSGAIAHARAMRAFRDPSGSAQETPRIIPQTTREVDPSGMISTFQPGGPTVTADNAFFQDLGTNGRTCFSCHQPQNGWGISAESIRDTYRRTAGTAPIFRLVDGAVCPTADVSTPQRRAKAYALLLNKGLIRIALPLPAGAEFAITHVDDPYDCNTNPVTGLTGPNSGILSAYRRPLPATNLGFINAIMWDGREPDLEHQAADATLVHAQADAAPTAAQIAEILAFEKGLLSAQTFDWSAHDLSANGATGGPKALQVTLASFFPGINDPLGGNPQGTPFSSFVFTLYDPWASPPQSDGEAAARASVARGQAVFNTKPIAITGVGGLNDVLQVPTIHGFCGTCHDSPNVGNHSVKLPINVGTANAGPVDPATGEGGAAGLDTSGLPVFTVSCTSGPLAGTTYSVTDLGRAMITGKCADIGKFRGPILRGLASRAPYFHNGSAARLEDVVDFYDRRFGMGFTDQEKTDLVNFLKTL